MPGCGSLPGKNILNKINREELAFARLRVINRGNGDYYVSRRADQFAFKRNFKRNRSNGGSGAAGDPHRAYGRPLRRENDGAQLDQK